jgi:hypothetical protein
MMNERKRKWLAWLLASPCMVLSVYILSFGVVEGLVYQCYNTGYAEQEEIPPLPKIMKLYYPLMWFCWQTKATPLLEGYVSIWYAMRHPEDWLLSWTWQEAYTIPNGTNCLSASSNEMMDAEHPNRP